ncbi:MAG: acylphosphatase [Betaproteobacteria bacterium AqS2]|uniref:Acylphosphatase n=1 Tax=Candidatus Amphirhobacter heronislandensis TaxID=1732024 RepID=A0A930UG36_9GAMM|nr:acylphosphatase [Betaproteobacteria bacterium AqS2]
MPDAGADGAAPQAACYRLGGRVQGVGMRAWLRRQALARGLAGWARNESDGTVTAVFVGPPAPLAQVADWIGAGPPGAAVRQVEELPAEAAGEAARAAAGFAILG